MRKSELDEMITRKFQEDKKIPERTKLCIEKTLEENRVFQMNKKQVKLTKLISVLTSIVIAFTGANVYAYSIGKPNIFSFIGQALNINNEAYEEEKIDISDMQELNNVDEEKQTLELKDYAYNDKVLIVKFIYKCGVKEKEYKELDIDIDYMKFLQYDELPLEIPTYEIAHKSTQIGENEYEICMVYDMELIRIENNKINIAVLGISNLDEQNEELAGASGLYPNQISEDKYLANFKIDINNEEKFLQKYIISTDEIKINTEAIADDLDIWGEPEIKILEINNTKLAGLIKLYSDADITIPQKDKDEYGYSYGIGARYGFEITDQNGNILNEKDSQILVLAADCGEEILIVKNLENVRQLNIKVYEMNTGNLVATQQVGITL